jgi:hypothetical protein
MKKEKIDDEFEKGYRYSTPSPNYFQLPLQPCNIDAS